MHRSVLVVVVAAALVAGCTSNRPSPAPSSTSVPPTSAAASPSPSALVAPSASAVAPTASVTASVEPTPVESTAPPSEPPSKPPPTAPGTPVAGQFDPAAITLSVEPYASGFGSLTFITNAGDGSGTMYAVEQGGRIKTFAQGDTAGGQLWLDISDRISSGGERGLLGLAFHPDFESNGRFFVDYTRTNGDSVISEFTRAADGTVDPTAERVLLTVNQPFPNHNGGMLAFGPDGYLYIGFGDGGSGGDPFRNGQNKGVLLGKILRIDVDSGDPYGIPADNPFANGGGAAEIWDYGMRNPWRFSFDRLSGGLFIGDVGQDAWEEVDVEPPGKGGRNYGWNVMEADHCYASGTCNKGGLTGPVASYSHSEGCSVTGGYVYRGSAYPQLYGGYVFTDYCGGQLWAFDADAALGGRSVKVSQLGSTGFAVSAFGEDETGELYVVDHAGTIYRLVATAV